MKYYDIYKDDDGDYEFYSHGSLHLSLTEMEFKALYYEMSEIMDELDKQ